MYKMVIVVVEAHKTVTCTIINIKPTIQPRMMAGGSIKNTYKLQSTLPLKALEMINRTTCTHTQTNP